MNKKHMVFLLICLASPMVMADGFADKIKLAISAETRTDKDKERDENRKPLETLEFFGIKEDMKVLELIPGGGWYTRILAPALSDKGQLYVAVGTGRVEKALLKEKGFEKVKILSQTSQFVRNEEQKLYDLKNIDLSIKNLDAVLTFRNYHNLTYTSRNELNQAAFNALKPGGIYGVVDHTRRHMQSNNDENGRRVDPILAIKEILSAGFVFVDYSDLHYRPDDELRFEVGRKSVTGNTDRFTFLFKKPE